MLFRNLLKRGKMGFFDLNKLLNQNFINYKQKISCQYIFLYFNDLEIILGVRFKVFRLPNFVPFYALS